MQSEVDSSISVTASRPSTLRPRRGDDGRVVPPRRHKQHPRLPYLLVLPAMLAVIAYMAYPLYRMVILTTHKTQLAGRFAPVPPPPKFVGWQNFKTVLTDGTFWQVVLNTVVFTVTAVALSMLISLAVALLMRRVSGWARIVLTISLVFVWAVPTIVATQVFAWLFDSDFGIVNALIDKLPGVYFQNHSWFSTSLQGWFVITALVLWGAIPFLALTLYAGLTQVPLELVEAATIDGANSWHVLRSVLLPVLRPLLIIATTLSAIWDFNVFNQIFALRNTQPEKSYWTIGIYAYEKAFVQSDYNTGATISLLTMVLLLGVMVFYVRQMITIGEAD
ncbi:MAG TPA: sugar ABC transporter permease [Micromonosporaceae bacterium]|nr:sugar ABC transporter permease [Micromonosporaceae bacterium]